MTMARSPTCLTAAYDPSANPALTGTPFTVTARSVRAMPMRKTSPDCSWPDLPSACSTIFQSGSAARAVTGAATIATSPRKTIVFNAWDFMGRSSLSSRVRLMEPGDVRPVDVLHECVDVLRRRGAVVQVVRVLVHIERQDRRGARHAVRVVGRPLVHQFAVAVRVGEEHPSRAATHRLAHGNELGPPPVNAPEVPHESLAKRAIGLALGAEAVEVQLVEDHRIHRDELFALEPVDHEHWRLREVEFGELRRDGVEAPDGAAVVVLPVADDQLLGQPVEFFRVAVQWLDGVCHVQPPLSAAARDAADGEVIKGSDGIGFRPQADAAGLEPWVTVIEVQRAVEQRLYVIVNSQDPDHVPLTERRGLHARGRELTAAPVVVVEPEIVLERVGPHDVVLAVGEAQHDAAGGVFLSGDRLELQRHVDIG